MKNIFIGFLFIVFDFFMPLANDGLVNFLPDFIGFWFLLKGIKELSGYGKSFVKAALIAKIMLVYYIVDFIANLTGTASKLLGTYIIEGFLFGFVVILVSLSCTHLVIKGILEMVEKLQNTELESNSLSDLETAAGLDDSDAVSNTDDSGTASDILHNEPQIEERYTSNIQTDKLYTAWKSYRIILIFKYICVYFMPGLALIALAASIFFNISLLIKINKVKNEMSLIAL